MPSPEGKKPWRLPRRPRRVVRPWKSPRQQHQPCSGHRPQLHRSPIRTEDHRDSTWQGRHHPSESEIRTGGEAQGQPERPFASPRAPPLGRSQYRKSGPKTGSATPFSPKGSLQDPQVWLSGQDLAASGVPLGPPSPPRTLCPTQRHPASTGWLKATTPPKADTDHPPRPGESLSRNCCRAHPAGLACLMMAHPLPSRFCRKRECRLGIPIVVKLGFPWSSRTEVPQNPHPQGL